MGLLSPATALSNSSHNWCRPHEGRWHQRDAKIEVEIDECQIELTMGLGLPIQEAQEREKPLLHLSCNYDLG
jgi:hypothetical protein